MERADLFAVSPGRGDRDALLRELPVLARRGVTRLLLREKSLAPAARRALAETLVPACRDHGLEPWISEDLELALATGAAGVQLAERSPSPLELAPRAPAGFGLGVSLHRPISRTPAELELCRHAFLGPVFATPGKCGALGLAGFRELAATLPLPVFAIGGIGPRELDELLAAGIRRIAAIRLFFGPFPLPGP